MIFPDTNALYWNTALDSWRSPTAEQFLVVLTPIVIEEIDRHKVHSTNPAIKRKAERLIRQISEYRRRSPLVKGSVLAKGVSKILALPVESNPQKFFPWLAYSADNLFLGNAMEIMKTNSRAPAVMVTRDVNLQTKIEMAGLTLWTPDLLAPKRP